MSHDLRPKRRPVRAARGVSPVAVSLVVLVSAVVVVALFAAGIAAEQYSSGQPAAGRAATSPAAETRPPGPGLGDAARDGRFEFVVSGLDCSRETVGVESLKRTAEGKYCVVSLSVRNVGDGSKYFVGRAQKAYDGSGAECRSDELAGLYINGGTGAFLRKLGPGEKLTGKLVFDVPEDARLTTLELHDAPLSGGVRVTVG